MFIQSITLLLTNFPLVMYVLSIILALLCGGKTSKSLFTLMLFFCVGLAGIWGFIMHTFFAGIAAGNIGWQKSPFEFEVALANLALGIAGIIGTFSSWAYRAAVTTVTTVFLWGAVIGHIYQILLVHNFSSGNAGAILVTDILIPLSLLILLGLNYPSYRKSSDLL